MEAGDESATGSVNPFKQPRTAAIFWAVADARTRPQSARCPDTVPHPTVSRPCDGRAADAQSGKADLIVRFWYRNRIVEFGYREG